MAIKVLPDEFAQDEERLRRFQREAKLLASLNHANIATLHGLEKSGGTQFLVMEVVEGETLAELIARGPIPIDEALALFKGIADGLEAAHDKGVIHRDLKPANVKISPDGTVTILDFGIAKAFVGEDETSVDASQSQSPTLARSTALGTIMGTASYMKPGTGPWAAHRQANGRVGRLAAVCTKRSLEGKCSRKTPLPTRLRQSSRTSRTGRGFRARSLFESERS